MSIERHEGFTLVELMIVVAVIGILSAIAIPNYQDFTIRAKVSDGLSMASPVKVAVVDNAASGAALDRATPGRDGVPSILTRNVSSLVVNGSDGEITITFGQAAGNGSLILSPRDGANALASGTIPTNTIVWNCRAQGSAKVGVANPTLQSKYAPADCR